MYQSSTTHSLQESAEVANQPIQDGVNPSNGKTDGLKKSRSKAAKRPQGEQYKRNRTIFNVAQLDALARIFQENQYPDAPLRKKIGERLGIDDERIQVSCR